MQQEKITLLENKRIVLGVTGSIAAYKAVDFASKLTQAGAIVDVVMTEAAQKFVTPLTFQAVTGRAVYTDLWQTENGGGLPTHIAHVGLGEGADLLIVAPATANTIAKLAHGMADDLLVVTALAVRCPVLVAPAMDGGMYNHPSTQDNLKKLADRGVWIIQPDEGRFASGLMGKGRLPETQHLLGTVRWALSGEGGLSDRKVVVTAGGTREAIDPVRYITNHSSGKQGYALAQAAADAGANVVLITTTTTKALPTPVGVERIVVGTAEEMLYAVQQHVVGTDVLIMAAAVADFRPETVAEQKIKKSGNGTSLHLSLTRTPDILLSIKATYAEDGWPRVSVGFAAESEDLLNNAESKLQRKGLDLIAANDITAADAGFGSDSNRVVLIDTQGNHQQLDLASKTAVSETIIGRIIQILHDKQNTPESHVDNGD